MNSCRQNSRITKTNIRKISLTKGVRTYGLRGDGPDNRMPGPSDKSVPLYLVTLHQCLQR